MKVYRIRNNDDFTYWSGNSRSPWSSTGIIYSSQQLAERATKTDKFKVYSRYNSTEIVEAKIKDIH